MPGQFIYLPDVEPAATANSPRIIQTLADSIALNTPGLKHVVSARAMTVGANGIQARCRYTGAALSARGLNADRFEITTVNGMKALGSGPAASGGQGAIAGLALPVGSLTPSYTQVLVLNLDDLDREGNYLTNVLCGFNGETYIRRVLRHYGVLYENPAGAGKFNIGASDNYVVTMDPPAGPWMVIVLDFDSSTRRMSMSINQAEVFSSAINTTAFTPPDETAYLELGYHVSNRGLRNSKIGDLYTFGESLLANTITRQQLQALVSALVDEYSIA